MSDLIELDWSVVTFCQHGSERILASTVDLGEDINQVYDLHGTLTGTVVATGVPLIVEDAATCTQYGQAPDGYRSYLGVPLRTPIGEVIGTICSFQRYPRRFTAEEVQLVELFAERAATAIDNYQLYQQQQQFNEMLEAEVIKRTVELRATQAKLMETNNQLEQRVEQRTAELTQVNQQLHGEIQERLEIEQALRESEQRFRALVEQAGDAFLVVDPTGRFLDANQRACDNLGYTRDELLALSVADVQKRLPPGGFAALRQQLAPGEPVTIDGIHQRKDGTTFPVEVRVGLVESGNKQFLLALARDMTERKQAQQEMMKALAALAEVGELAAMIVHEVRNPLTTVMMGLSSFKRLDLPDLVREQLMLAIEEAERIRNLLKEILLYAKPQALQCSELELNAFVAEILEPIRTLPSVLSREIKFFPAPTEVRVLADRDKLKQVVINLIDNACEAIAEGSVVTSTLELTRHHAYIRVHNLGNPIPPDVLPKLTKPFYTTKASGTGLGLAIVKRIVEAHSGELEIQSSTAAGTTVTVKLPLASSRL